MTQLEIVLERAINDEKPISLDSSALIAYLANEEPIAQIVAEVLETEVPVILSAIAVSESLVRTVQTYGLAFAETIMTSLQESDSVHLLPFGPAQLIEAAVIRAETRLKLPDAAIVATARVAGAIAIVGNDREWQNKALGIRYIHLDDVVREQEEEIR